MFGTDQTMLIIIQSKINELYKNVEIFLLLISCFLHKYLCKTWITNSLKLLSSVQDASLTISLGWSDAFD